MVQQQIQHKEGKEKLTTTKEFETSLQAGGYSKQLQ